MAIKSGIGFGAAQVFNTADKLVNTYANIIKTQQAKRQKEDEKYLNKLAEFAEMGSRKGVRPVDEPVLTSAWDSIKKRNEMAASIVNPAERRKALTEIQKAMGNYKALVDRSIQENQDIYSFSVSHADKKDLLDPSFVNILDQRSKTTIDKLPERFNPMSVVYKPNPLEREKIQKELMGELETLAKYDKKLDKPIGGGKREAYKVVAPGDAILAITAKINQRPEYRKLAYATFAEQNPGVTPTDELVAQNEYKLTTPKGPIVFKANVYDPNEGARKATDADKLIDITVNAFKGDKSAMEDIKALAGGKIVRYRYKDGKLVGVTPKVKFSSGLGLESWVDGEEIPVNTVNDLISLMDQLGVNKSNIDLLKGVQSRIGRSTQAAPTPKPSGNTNSGLKGKSR